MSDETAETKKAPPPYLEAAGGLYRRVAGAERVEDARWHQRMDALTDRFLTQAGGTDEARKLLWDLDLLYSQRETAAVERLFRAVGQLVVPYRGPGPDLWRAMYFKLTGEREGSPAGSGVDEGCYEPGAEWRYVWGEDCWRDEAKRQGIAVPAEAGGDDGD